MNSVKLWVDADACPIAIKELIIRAVKRTGIPATFVANQYLNIPKLPGLEFIQVGSGFDVADHLIVTRVAAGDLVVTQDIPLADEVIAKQAEAIGPRGEFYTRENIKSRLNMRDFMETMRSSGVQSGGPAPLNSRDIQTFANQLDRWLRQHTRS